MSGAGNSTARLRQALADAGLAAEIRQFPDGTRTAADAAAAIGCTIAQIAKSLIFRRADCDRPVLVVTSGTNRVDAAKVGALLGTDLSKADARFVRARTGYAIGGVAPLGLTGPVDVVIDRDLAAHTEIWAAAGAPTAVFGITFDALAAATGGQVADVRED